MQSHNRWSLHNLVLSRALVSSAQHSVHLTGGYVPRFQAFSLVEVGSVKMALSRPTRQQVTHAVGRFLNTHRRIMIAKRTLLELISDLREHLSDYHYSEFQIADVPQLGTLYQIMTPRRW